MTILLSILVFVLILGFLVFIHELGHFLAAKAFHIKVKEFGLGIPPRAFGIKRGETIYSLNWIPVGGFVSIEGEDDQTKVGKGSFGSVNRFKRAVVLVAGVAMNFLVAAAVYSFIFAQGVEVPTDRVRITEVTAGSPAQMVGLAGGDLVISADGEKVDSLQKLQSIIGASLGQPMDITIERDGQREVFNVTPRIDPPAGEGALGVVLRQDTEQKTVPIYQAPVEGTRHTLNQLGLILSFLGNAVTSIPAGKSDITEQVSGPVGIAYVTYRVVQIDPGYLLELTALISLSLALMNVLPLPALDGGRLAFVGLSALFRRDFYPKLEQIIHQAGLVFFLLLFVLITYNDLVRIVTSTSLGAKLSEIFKALP